VTMTERLFFFSRKKGTERDGTYRISKGEWKFEGLFPSLATRESLNVTEGKRGSGGKLKKEAKTSAAGRKDSTFLERYPLRSRIWRIDIWGKTLEEKVPH